MRLFHIVDRDVWARAERDGWYRPASLDADGFVHFSFPDQVAATANFRYRDVPNLCVVEIDPATVGAEVVVEDSYGSGTEFPHVYGAIPTAARVATHDLGHDAGGAWTFDVSGGGAGALASPGR